MVLQKIFIDLFFMVENTRWTSGKEVCALTTSHRLDSWIVSPLSATGCSSLLLYVRRSALDHLPKILDLKSKLGFMTKKICTRVSNSARVVFSIIEFGWLLIISN